MSITVVSRLGGRHVYADTLEIIVSESDIQDYFINPLVLNNYISSVSYDVYITDTD